MLGGDVLGFNAVAVSAEIGAGAISSLGIAFAFGLGVTLAITALGQITGGHFNPAVSLGLAVARKFPPREVVPYWIAQLAGGFVAVLAIAVVYSERATDALDTAPGLGISNWGARARSEARSGCSSAPTGSTSRQRSAPPAGCRKPSRRRRSSRSAGIRAQGEQHQGLISGAPTRWAGVLPARHGSVTTTGAPREPRDRARLHRAPEAGPEGLQARLGKRPSTSRT